MAVITTEKLTPTVGAHRRGRRPRAAAADDETLPAWTLDALEANGVLVFRGLHLDDEAQVAFSRKLGTVEKLGKGELPRDLPGHPRPGEEPRRPVPQGHLRLAHRRLHRRHPDHGHDAQRPRRGRDAAARPSSPAPTRPTTTSPTTRRHASSRCGSSTPSRRRSALHNPDPSPEEVEMLAPRARPRSHPLVWTHRSGPQVARARRHHRPASRAWTDDEGRALLDDLLDRSTAPERVLPPRVGGGRPRDLGQPRRAPPGLPVRPDLAPRHAPHHLQGRRADPVSAAPAGRHRHRRRVGHRPGHQRAARRPTARRRRARPRRRPRPSEAAAKIAAGGRHRHRRRRRRHRPAPRSRPPSADVVERARRADDPREQRRARSSSARSSRSTSTRGSRVLDVNLTGTFHCCQVVLPAHDRAPAGAASSTSRRRAPRAASRS